MNTANEYDAKVRAAWEIELAKSEFLRSIISDGTDPETARLLWSHGFASGASDAAQQFKQFIRSAA